MRGRLIFFGAFCALTALARANDVEPLLLGALQEIQASRIHTAEQRVDELLNRFPNFRLGHLIKGDLLLARARPLSAMGAGAGAPTAQIEGLRAEALVRTRRAATPPPENSLPAMVWRLGLAEQHLVVVDTSSSRLYLFENHGGELRRVADYYVSIGRLGAGKTREGDQKTPIGIYQTTGSIAPTRLSDFYGSGALTLNYPSEWDRRQGRSGHGIWLHGTPSDTYSRPPLASDGCVVMANRELEDLAARVKLSNIPVVIVPKLNWVAPEQAQLRGQEFLHIFETWRTDWESRDTERYLAHYAASFQTQGKGVEAWREHKRAVNAHKRFIRVGISNLSVFQHPEHEALAVVSFEQDYQSDNLANRMRKQQYWQKLDGRWQIIYEGAANVPNSALAQGRGTIIKVAAKGSRKPPKTKRS